MLRLHVVKTSDYAILDFVYQPSFRSAEHQPPKHRLDGNRFPFAARFLERVQGVVAVDINPVQAIAESPAVLGEPSVELGCVHFVRWIGRATGADYSRE